MKKVVLLICLISLSCGAADIKVSGGAAPMNNIFKRIKDAFEKKTGHTLILNEQSPELSLQALDKAQIDVASAGLQWDDWLKLCKEKNIRIDESKAFLHFVVGKDTIIVYVNKKAKVAKLSFNQLEKIFSGQAKSWKEFGGDDKPINVVFSPNIAGTNKFFSKTIMAGKSYKSELVDAKNAEDIASIVGKDEMAIGFGPVGVEMEKYGIKAVQTEEIFRPITMAFISSDKAVLELQRFLNSADGQNLIKR